MKKINLLSIKNISATASNALYFFLRAVTIDLKNNNEKQIKTKCSWVDIFLLFYLLNNNKKWEELYPGLLLSVHCKWRVL